MYYPWLSLGIFVIKTVIIVLAILTIMVGFLLLLTRHKLKNKENITINKLNDHYQHLKTTLQQHILPKKAYKLQQKNDKTLQKKHKQLSLPRLFVLNFKGDIKASAVGDLCEQINMLLTILTPKDKVLLRLESSGGMVNAYGLAASQLQRLRQKHIPLIVAIDKVAASGGYMMASVASKIIAAPFAIIGSIGVVMQLPNFHRLLKKHHIDFEQITAGQYKRTLSLFGENNDKDRQKMQQDIDDIHHLFSQFIKNYRPQVAIEQVATGEYWLGYRAKALKLVDELIVSDDYLLNASRQNDIFAVTTLRKKTFSERLLMTAKHTIGY